jgi:phosphoribosylamine--glycine ligase
VTATRDTLNVALQKAYEAVGKIQFDGMHYRKDIGKPQQQTSAAGD